MTEALPRAGTLLTYGDACRVIGGNLEIENRAARLRGRKIYPHQEAVNDSLDHCQGQHGAKSQTNPDGPIMENERAMLARHVSTTLQACKS